MPQEAIVAGGDKLIEMRQQLDEHLEDLGVLGEVIKLLLPSTEESVMPTLGLGTALIPSRAEGLENLLHASGRLFNKFNKAKIGTGEGAQAFGHGHYFTENPQVANFYLPDALGGHDSVQILGKPGMHDIYVGDELVPGWLMPRAGNGTTLAFDPTNKEEFISALNSYVEQHVRLLDSGDEYMDKITQDGVDRALSIKEQLIRGADPEVRDVSGGGYVYETRINADPNNLIDLDGGNYYQHPGFNDAISDYRNQWRALFPGRGLPDLSKLADPSGAYLGNVSHEKYLFALINDVLGQTDNVYPGLDTLSKKNWITDILSRDFNIPGIRFLDGFSRRGGDGTSNYVIYNDDIIEILNTLTEEEFVNKYLSR